MYLGALVSLLCVRHSQAQIISTGVNHARINPINVLEITRLDPGLRVLYRSRECKWLSYIPCLQIPLLFFSVPGSKGRLGFLTKIQWRRESMVPALWEAGTEQEGALQPWELGAMDGRDTLLFLRPQHSSSVSHQRLQSRDRVSARFSLSLSLFFFFFFGTGAWTPGLRLEPLYQSYFVKSFLR
jgi:hypothetical protein